MGDAHLDIRFARKLGALGLGEGPRHLLVAFSGGVDSAVLLHLLRFRCQEMPLTITAAHLDHRMRSDSGADSAWVRGVCLAWGIPLESGVARAGLTNEQDARDARYEFLHSVARRIGSDHIVTAHHADDQAETVLFRVLRGTGIPGLAGIPERTASGILRPLLPFWRKEIEAYAVENAIAWRTDPTNALYGPARNRIRHELLPLIEREISPAARQSLVSLAELARAAETDWRAIVRSAYSAVVSELPDVVLLDRETLGNQPAAIATRVVRKALRRFGIVPGRDGTRSTLKFITDAPSGREIHLPGNVRVVVEFECAKIYRAGTELADVPLRIPLLSPGEVLGGDFRLAGRRFIVRARVGAADLPSRNGSGGARWAARLRLDPDQFPLTVRGRTPGDRIRTKTGTKRVKKLMIEERIPRTERAGRPVVVDAAGKVLWIAGTSASGAGRNDSEIVLDLEIRDG